MSWTEQIDLALRRAKSGLHSGDVLAALRRGDAEMAVGDRMHASVIFWPDGSAEIGHVFGVFNRTDALWMFARLRAVCVKRGVSLVKVTGRAGWRRFLKQKGLDDGREWQ